MKTPIRFLSQLSKIENSLGSKYLLPRKCSTSVTTLTLEKLISTPDREKITISLHSKQQKFRKYTYHSERAIALLLSLIITRKLFFVQVNLTFQ
jgi:hypothetical protein